LQQVRGMEMQFVVNHLGHFILVNRLLDRVVAAPQGRVVVVGSMAHAQVPPGGIQFDNLSGQGWERQAYGHSKLANGLFSFELAKRLQGTRATSNSLHPGVVATNIMRNLNFTPPAGGGANRGGGGGGGVAGQRHGPVFRRLQSGRSEPNAKRPGARGALVAGVRRADAPVSRVTRSGLR
jgi:NAD(P)-dependent dehydrogenase (short-subunit alcohol dehydrogenase family)